MTAAKIPLLKKTLLHLCRLQFCRLLSNSLISHDLSHVLTQSQAPTRDLCSSLTLYGENFIFTAYIVILFFSLCKMKDSVSLSKYT